MGSVGTMTTEGDHREYLKNGNFENLDEYEEELMHDNAFEERNDREPVEMGDRIHRLEQAMDRVELGGREAAEFRRGLVRDLRHAETEDDRNKLRELIREFDAMERAYGFSRR